MANNSKQQATTAYSNGEKGRLLFFKTQKCQMLKIMLLIALLFFFFNNRFNSLPISHCVKFLDFAFLLFCARSANVAVRRQIYYEKFIANAVKKDAKRRRTREFMQKQCKKNCSTFSNNRKKILMMSFIIFSIHTHTYQTHISTSLLYFY